MARKETRTTIKNDKEARQDLHLKIQLNGMEFIQKFNRKCNIGV